MRIASRIKSLERVVKDRRGACAVCNGAGKPVFIGMRGEGDRRGGPCPSCGRAITVRFVDMLAQRRTSGPAPEAATPCS